MTGCVIIGIHDAKVWHYKELYQKNDFWEQALEQR